MTPEQERIERLEKALLELVYYARTFLCEGWYTGYHGDYNVSDVIGDLLDKHKPKDPSL